MGVVIALGLTVLLGFLFQIFANRRLLVRLRSAEEERYQTLAQLSIATDKATKLGEIEGMYQLLSIEHTEAKAALHHERQKFQEKMDLLSHLQGTLTETFKTLSQQALLTNNQSFLDLAKTSIGQFFEKSQEDFENKQKGFVQLVDPVQKALTQVDQKIGQLEKERLDAYSDLRRQLSDLLSTQKELRLETGNLVKALRTPTARGQWGEMQLRRVVEIAGMIPHCDFIEQAASDDQKSRPDMIVKLPGGKNIVVDAKTPLASYLEAIESQNDQQRSLHLENHARQVRAHIRALGQRTYWEQFQPTPEFVVMFLPSEAFFSAALEKDPPLIEYGVQEKVILATPTTLIALLKAVSFGWRQENIAENAKAIGDLGKELYKRLGSMVDHMGQLGGSLHKAVASYNKTIGTFEGRVLVSARKMNDLDSSLGTKSLNPLAEIEIVPKTTQRLQSQKEDILKETLNT